MLAALAGEAGHATGAAAGREAFAGDWRISRRITDHKAGQEGRFDGTARFHAVGPDLLRYDETGQLRLGEGAAFEASRSYLWRFAGTTVHVSFDDGRPFHRFSLIGAAQADHWCDPDAYRVAYDFSIWPDWRAVWTVTGPRKDYVMDSVYARP